MAFLNADERTKLRDDLKALTFERAKGRLHRLDPKGRLAYYRNAQTTGQLSTRFELKGLGTRVTLLERQNRTPSADGRVVNSTFELIDVIVEPTPENRL